MNRVLLIALLALCTPFITGGGCGLLSQEPPTNDGQTMLTSEEQELRVAIEPGAQIVNSGAIAFEDFVEAESDDPVESLIAALELDPDVADARRSVDDATVIVEMTNGRTVAVFTDTKDRADWTTAPAKARSAGPRPPDGQQIWSAGDRKVEARASDVEDFIICDETSYPQSPKACVVQGFGSQFGQNTADITTPLERAGYDVQTLGLSSFGDVSALLSALSDCGVLYISTHGGVGEHQGRSANLLATEIPVSFGDQEAFAAQIQEAAQKFGADQVQELFTFTGANGQSYWALTPEFFSRATYQGTFVYVDACQSDTQVASGGRQLRDAFLDHGAGAFIGWSDSISTKFSNPATAKIFDGLAPADFGVEELVIVTSPSNPGAGEDYVPSVQVRPPAAGIEVRLHIIGTDGFQLSETKFTDGFGEVEFSVVPGGASQVTDTLTAVTGGADNGGTVVEVAVKNDPELPESCRLPWQNGEVSIASLNWRVAPGKSESYNIVCNNPDVTSTQEVVKFE